MTLTNDQKATFDAAGQAIKELGFKITISCDVSGVPELGTRFFAFTSHPQSKALSLFGQHCDTLAEAVASIVDARDKAITSPRPMTAKEVVESVLNKDIPDDVRVAVAALPVG